MNINKFAEATRILNKKEYAERLLAEVEKPPVGKYITIDNLKFVNYNPGQINIGDDKDGLYLPGMSDFNNRVITDFKIELKKIITNLQTEFDKL